MAGTSGECCGKKRNLSLEGRGAGEGA